VEWNRKAFNVRGKKGDGVLGLIVNKRCVGSDGEIKIQRGDSVEDLMWVRVAGDCGLWYVCVMYMRPGGRWVERRNRVWEAYVRGVTKFKGQGRIVVLTDANVRIGEVESKVGGRVFERRSEDKVEAKEGRDFVEACSELGLVLLNGIRGSVARCTSFHRSGVGKSVIDFIGVEAEVVEEWGEVKIGEFGRGESDHEMVIVDWKGWGVRGVEEGDEELHNGRGDVDEKEKKRQDVDEKEKKGQEGERVEIVRGARMWAKLEKRGPMMQEWIQWVREEGGEHDIDAIYGKWIGKVKEVVEGGEEDELPEKERVEGRIWGRDLEVLRKKKIKARGKWVRLEEGEEQDREKKKWVELRKEMKRMVRRKKVQDKMDRMRKIEAMGRKDPRGMWQGWKRWEKKGGREKEISKMKDGDGEWVSGKEVLGKWEEVFRKVVVERKGDYDDK
jgi:hypothetical protein